MSEDPYPTQPHVAAPDPNATTPPPPADTASIEQLLCGLLGVQWNLFDRAACERALVAWQSDRTGPLGEVLLKQGAIDAPRRKMLEALLQKYLDQYNRDPVRSLESLSSLGTWAERLEPQLEPGLQATLAHVGQSTRSLSGTVRSSGRSRFRILKPHARGGLGEVFLARDEEVDRDVALKEIQARYGDHEESRVRFLKEAEITGKLEHPGIVPIYGLGTYDDGRPYYAMRFIQGDSLEEAIKRFHDPNRKWKDRGEQELEFRKLLQRFIDVCNAIEYAHSKGILHRDLKPGNVMLGKYGETLVVDWGLAKRIGDKSSKQADGFVPHASAASGQPDLTQYGQALGTPAFMSPEQAAGMLDELGRATDVYGLGATLFALLTGRPPFVGKALDELLRNVRRGEFAAPRSLNRKIPRALNAICLKAMSLKPSDRYDSARAIASDVEQWLADERVSAYRESLPTRLNRWRKRHPAVVASVTLLLISTCLFGGVLYELRNRQEHAEGRRLAQQAAQLTFEQAYGSLDAEVPERGILGLTNALEIAERIADSELGASIRLHLSAWKNRFPSRRLLSYESSNSVVNGLQESMLSSCSVSRSGVLAIASAKEVSVFAAGDLSQSKRLAIVTEVPALSCDGGTLFTADLQTVRMTDLTGTNRPSKSYVNHERIVRIVPNEDGSRAAVIGPESIVVWNVVDGSVVRCVWSNKTGFVGSLFEQRGAFGFGDAILLLILDRQLHAWNLETGDALELPPKLRELRNVVSVTTSKGHERGAISCDDGRFVIWSAPSWKKTNTMSEVNQVFADAEFYRHSAEIITTRFGNDSRILYVLSQDFGTSINSNVRFSLKKYELDLSRATPGISVSVSSRSMSPRLAIDGADACLVVCMLSTAQMATWKFTWPAAVLERAPKQVAVASDPPTERVFVRDGKSYVARTWDHKNGGWGATQVVDTRSGEAHCRTLRSTDGNTFVTPAQYSAAAFDPQRNRVGIADTWKGLNQSGGIAICRGTDGSFVREVIRTPFAIKHIVVNHDATRALLIDGNDKASVWDLTLAKPQPEGYVGATAIAMSRDGKRFAVVSNEGRKIAIVDADTAQEIGPPITIDDRRATELCFSADGAKLAAILPSPTGYGATKTIVRVWDVGGQHRLLTELQHQFHIRAIGFDEAGEHIATVCADGNVRYWKIEPTPTTSRKVELRGIDYLNPSGSIEFPCIASFTKNGSKLLMENRNTGEIDVFQHLVDSAEARPVVRAGRSPSDEVRISFNDRQQRFQAWIPHPIDDLIFRRLKPTIVGLQSIERLDAEAKWKVDVGFPVACTASNDDGSIFVAAGGTSEYVTKHELRLWNTNDGTPHGPVIALDDRCTDLEFDEDGNRLLVIAGGIRLVDTSSGRWIGSSAPGRRAGSILSERQLFTWEDDGNSLNSIDKLNGVVTQLPLVKTKTSETLEPGGTYWGRWRQWSGYSDYCDSRKLLAFVSDIDGRPWIQQRSTDGGSHGGRAIEVNDRIAALKYDPTGRWLAVRLRNQVGFFDISGGKRLGPWVEIPSAFTIEEFAVTESGWIDLVPGIREISATSTFKHGEREVEIPLQNWPVAIPSPSLDDHPVEFWKAWARVATGLELSADGAVTVVTPQRWLELEREQSEFGYLGGNSK